MTRSPRRSAWRILLAPTAALALGAAVPPSAAPQVPEAKVYPWAADLARVSGLDREVIEAVNESRLMLAELCADSSVCSRYADIVDEAIAAATPSEALAPAAALHLNAELLDDDERKYRQWLASPLGEKVSLLERQMRTAKSRRLVLRRKEEIKANVGEQRFWDIDTIDSTLDTSAIIRQLNSFSVRIVEHVASTVATAFPEQVESEEDRFRRSRRASASVQPDYQAQLTFQFAGLNDEEMKLYIEVVESPAFRRFNSARLAAFRASVGYSSREIYRTIEARLAERLAERRAEVAGAGSGAGS